MTEYFTYFILFLFFSQWWTNAFMLNLSPQRRWNASLGHGLAAPFSPRLERFSSFGSRKRSTMKWAHRSSWIDVRDYTNNK